MNEAPFSAADVPSATRAAAEPATGSAAGERPAPHVAALHLLHGLIWRTPAAIPFARNAPASAAPDVVVRDDLPPGPMPGRPLEPMWRISADGRPLFIKRDFAATVEAEDAVSYAAAPGLDPLRIGLELAYGPGAGLLHLRGGLPMHAAVAAGGAGAALMLGPPGGGKSTLTALLAGRGWSPGGDDIVAVDPDGPEGPVAHRALPTAKVFADSRAVLGGEALVRPGFGYGKTILSLDDGRAGADWPAPLRAIVVLRWLHPAEARPRLRRLAVFDALAELRAAVALPALAEALGRGAALLPKLARLSATLPVYELGRPRRYDVAAESAELIRRAVEDQGQGERRA